MDQTRTNNSTHKDHPILGETLTITIDDLEGWNPIQVIYELSRMHNSIKLEWYISGTEKKFHIPLHTVYEHDGTIETHLRRFLKVFREDYLDWHSQNFVESWMKNYQSQFKSHILIDI